MPALYSGDEVRRLMNLAGSAARGRTVAERFVETLEGLKELVPHAGSNAWVLEPAKETGEVLYVERLPQKDLEDYIVHYRHHDPMAPYILAAPRVVKTLSDAARWPAIERTEFSDLLHRGDIKSIAGWSQPLGGGRYAALALHRGFGQPDFDERERELLALVFPLLSAIAEEHVRRPAPLDRLTPAERSVVELLIRGSPDRAIASRLGVGFATVRTHIQNAFTKLQVSSRIELLHLVVQGCPPLSPE